MTEPSSIPPELPDGAASALPSKPSLTRFCRQCGAPWQPDWTQCPRCAEAGSTLSAQTEVAADYSRDMQSLKSAVALYFALLGVSVVMIITAALRNQKESAIAELIGGGAFALIVLGWCNASRGTISALLKHRFHAGWLLVALVSALPTYALASVVVHLISGLAGGEQIHYLEVFTKDGFGFGWAIGAVCLEPALFEELAFRGLIQSSLETVLGQREALFTSALMFGILHLSIPSLPHLLVLGLVLGWLRVRTQSLWPGMVLHFTHNFLVILSEQTHRFLPW